MSNLVVADSAFVAVSILFNSESISFDEVTQIILNKFGEGFLFFHNFCPMAHYYSIEMGDIEKLKRIILVSPILINRSQLVEYKLWSDQIEKTNLNPRGLRTVNIDIGILSSENLILASGKKYAHRIYLDKGVYAELALQFKENTFHPLPWTYPDYAHLDFIDFFSFVRKILIRKNNIKNS